MGTRRQARSTVSRDRWPRRHYERRSTFTDDDGGGARDIVRGMCRPVVDLDRPASDPERRVLSPEVQLLYKSASPGDEDEADFRAVLNRLHASQRRWLSESLAIASPDHPWLARL